ncbi:hypothetical protein SARC_01747 [Sphaeroforma arctica JP610]|uniref:DUF4922 domain-containing protein n=1 Tax=Sphaeroforma arctica JP610 TaxID=667725 RepID=A0A0L0GCZ0_9EUKA|nr:hypothetical protein SARC_01747 [Sphaeroforma arctica JP610]KNC86088.1 hypothetical protein SARC_01747 [Sphaeroforma arctica JP610]|eukprot:XP_014159990.1 hypothetical protein SARC_01747 [Sphaeroforma arctica JP610]
MSKRAHRGSLADGLVLNQSLENRGIHLGPEYFDKAATQAEFQVLCDTVRKEYGTSCLWRYIYEWCLCSEYISEERLSYNIVYKPSTVNDFGVPLQVTINRSKPEIVAGQKSVSSLAPGAQCVICFENVASAGKPGLRAYEFVLNGRSFFVQYPPYPYCDGHAVVIEREHTAQIITRNTVDDLLDFATNFEHLCISSNTDKSGTGASILQHRHYQVSGMRLPLFSAVSAADAQPMQYGAASVSVLHYPVVAIRIEGTDTGTIAKAATRILDIWRSEEFCAAEGFEVDQQTMSFSALHEYGNFILIMVPRTTTAQTNPHNHCIKHEFVGILEMAGYAVLPARLHDELAKLEGVLENNSDPAQLPADLTSFAPFVDDCWTKIEDKDPHSRMEAALNAAFANIIRENSPYDSTDKTKTMRLVNKALEH